MKTKKTKDCYLMMRMDSFTKAELKALSERKGVTMSEYVESLLKKAFKREGVII